MARQANKNIWSQSIEALLKEYPALFEAVWHGVDITLLPDNLKLSISERIHRLQKILTLFINSRKTFMNNWTKK